MPVRYVDDDFLAVRHSRKSKHPFVLAFGDAVEVLDESDPDWTQVRALSIFDGAAKGWVRGRPKLRDEGVLKLSMVDVQQGDGLVIETPSGQIVLVDGGDNELFARHVAERFRHRGASSPEAPLEVAAIVVTHGDADHFQGLNLLRRSEDDPGLVHQPQKRLHLRPRTMLHNGLVKGPTKLGETGMFGRNVKHRARLMIVDLYDDPRQAPKDRRNQFFRSWCDTLDHWERRGAINCRRVAQGMDPAQVFDFLVSEGIGVEIQGPFATTVQVDDVERPALPFLHEPKRSSEIHLQAPGAVKGGLSASHTINGHSIALRLTYGNVRFSLTGDLNQESMEILRDRLPLADLEAEIVKAPHHGSHDFDLRALAAMKPVVAIVSSGDESSRKEHIHPRATLMAALGKVMRHDTGVIFCTELAAFFEMRHGSHTREALEEFFAADPERTYTGAELAALFNGRPRKGEGPKSFFGFERTSFGKIEIRTDGERVLVFTRSGKQGVHEAYRFTVKMHEGERRVAFAPEVSTR